MSGKRDDRTAAQTEADVAEAPFKEGALISARGVSFRVDGADKVSQVDIDIAPGEFLTLVGPDGSGKSTLVSLLLGITAPTSGRVQRAADCVLGLVPQEFTMPPAIPMTVERFLTLGRRRDRPAQAAMLADVGAGTVAERQVSDLDANDLQRVLIARALLRNPALLVLDEPARSADYGGAADLYALAARLRGERGVAVLLVARDLHPAFAGADRIICLQHSIVAEGRPADVASHPDVARLFGPLAARMLAAPIDDPKVSTSSDEAEARP